MLIKLAKVVFSEDRRPSRYKVWNVDTVILSIQDSIFMILGLTCWYEVNLRSAMMIRDPLDARSGLTFNGLQWWSVILSMQDPVSHLMFCMMIHDPLDTRSCLTFSFSAMMIRDPLDTRFGLTFRSAMMICDPLDTRSGFTFNFLHDDPWSSRYKIRSYLVFFSAVMICNPLVLKRSRLWHHFFCFLSSFKYQRFFFITDKISYFYLYLSFTL